MRLTIAHERALRALGAGILAVFAFGTASGPLRDCVSHPGHAAGQHSAEHVASSSPGPTASAGHLPASEHDGCSCLGLCSLEQAPGLTDAWGPRVAYTPNAPKALVAASARPHAACDAFDLPLARPPPAVV